MPLERGRRLEEADDVLLTAFGLVVGVGGLVPHHHRVRLVLEVVLLRPVHLQTGLVGDGQIGKMTID